MHLARFRHKGLRQLYEDDIARGVPPAMADKLRKLFFALETADDLEKVSRFPGWKLHPLKGDLKGFWSLTVTGNWRLIFLYDQETNTASDINMIDYHWEIAMPMKNPPHPGDLIRTGIIEALALSVSKAAEILKVRRATLSDLLHGKAALTPEMALRIERAFGPDMNHLLAMQLAYDVAKTRQRSKEIDVKRYVPA
jgi:addiction module HigA family antidote